MRVTMLWTRIAIFSNCHGMHNLSSFLTKPLNLVLWVELMSKVHHLSKNKVAHCNMLLDRLLLWLWIAFAVAFRQLYAISQHLFPIRVSYIFGQDFLLMTGESNHSFSLFQHIPKAFIAVKSGLYGGQFMCENDSSCSLTLTCPHAPLFRARWILELSSWNMPKPSGKKKSIDGITWSFSTFRNSADLLCLDLTNWSKWRLFFG